RNAVLAFALSFLVLTVWMTLDAKNRPQRVPAQPAEIAREGDPGPGGVETTARSESAPSAIAPAPPAVEVAPPAMAEELPFENPQVRGVLSSRGAGIVRWDLLEYTTPANEGGQPVPLIALEGEDAPAFATPFADLGLGDLSTAVFEVVERGPRVYAFELARDGLRVRKRFELPEEGYLGRLRIEVENRTERSLEPRFAVRLVERVRPLSDFRDLALVALVEG